MEYIIAAVIFGLAFGVCVGAGVVTYLGSDEKIIESQDREIELLNKMINNYKQVIENDELIIGLKDDLINKLDRKIEDLQSPKAFIDYHGIIEGTKCDFFKPF